MVHWYWNCCCCILQEKSSWRSPQGRKTVVEVLLALCTPFLSCAEEGSINGRGNGVHEVATVCASSSKKDHEWYKAITFRFSPEEVALVVSHTLRSPLWKLTPSTEKDQCMYYENLEVMLRYHCPKCKAVAWWCQYPGSQSSQLQFWLWFDLSMPY